ncbi:MAG: hypothetical protein HUU32_16915 [Calditrichaceae bacterium]|nr:hypothetical protein [Calditrichia bacterium]NUQ43073.1 hypothetical protein [Calditrichaceae bacterium]
MPQLKMQVVLKAEAPIAVLRTRASSQFVKTLDYLPGSAVRGAFAEIFINKRGTEDPDFKHIFVEENIWFSDFLPNYADESPLVLPLSAMACKRYGLSHTQSVQDRLIHEITGAPRSESSKRCPECGEPLDRVSGYLSDLKTRKNVKIGRQLRMHVGISGTTGSAMHGLLFSYEMLTEKETPAGGEVTDMKFIGTLESDSGEVLEALQKVIPSREHLSVGKARTRGLGELSIQYHEKLKSANSFLERWDNFNAGVVKHGGDPQQCYFSIILDSHLALKDRLGRPVLGDIQAAHLGLEESAQVEICAAFLAPVVVPGWNAAQGLPKPDTHALSRGSVLTFCAPETLKKSLRQQVMELEKQGLGERRAEGFGKLSVCHPFHLNI